MQCSYPEPDITILRSHTTVPPLWMDISQEAIESLQSQLSGLEDIEAALKKLSEQVASVQQGARRRLYNYQSIVAPIRRVPDDVLGEIFLAFMDTSDHGYDTIPITLASVCGRWRTLAHSTPRLWYQITVSVTPSNHLSLANFIRHYTSLSATRPLWLNLKLKGASSSDSSTGSTSDVGATVEAGQLFVNALAASASRWQAVRLTPSILDFVSEALLSAEALLPAEATWNLPILECLEIDCSADDEWPDICDPTVFALAPRLRQISYSSDDQEILREMNLPWCQIEELFNFHLQLDDYADLVNRCPKLIYCRNFSVICGLEEHGRGDTVKHNAIQSIDIKISCRQDLETFFTHFQFPSLAELRFGNWLGLQPIWSQDHFTKFISCCTLQRLALDGIVASKDLPFLLASVPNVSEFHFTESSKVYTEAEAVFDTRIIERLTFDHQPSLDNSHTNLLPHLRILSLMGGLRFSIRAFSAMIKSRTAHTCHYPAVFQSLYIQIQRQKDMASAGRTAETYEPPLDVHDFKEVQDILHERAYISVESLPSAYIVFP
ncbi:hypothetical protein FIBSPDRAFT_151269 [Athelia psychrophila]|uniref:F-box domain-containing protein n=1 Tax=Athelia psychrophila TaxID=1759441 RepID=A0A166BMM2_9AGAM|nr:hypothetical protein FIBSPDRAFT_151269 [Fibularhizoctonia sp. CBS 109695]